MSKAIDEFLNIYFLKIREDILLRSSIWGVLLKPLTRSLPLWLRLWLRQPHA